MTSTHHVMNICSYAEAKRVDGALEAARSVFSRLLECWAECGPAQLVSAPELQAAQCLAAIATCANLLLQMQPALAGALPSWAAPSAFSLSTRGWSGLMPSFLFLKYVHVGYMCVFYDFLLPSVKVP